MENKLGGGRKVDDLAKAWEFIKTLLPAVLIAIIGSPSNTFGHRSQPFSGGVFIRDGCGGLCWSGYAMYLQRAGRGEYGSVLRLLPWLDMGEGGPSIY